MLLFIISEVMLFGAFFTAYFFIRVVADDPWPADGHASCPLVIAGVNTAILFSSSFTMHWALECARSENRNALRAGLLTTFLLGLDFLSIQINEYVHLGFATARPRPRHRSSTGSPACMGPTCSWGSHCWRSPPSGPSAGTSPARSTAASRCPGIYWHFVDVMWLVRLHNALRALASLRC